MNQCASQFIAVSEVVKEHWINKGIQREKMTRVYNGVQQKEMNMESTSGVVRNKKQTRLVMVGNIIETKGQIWAIEAVKKLCDENIQVSLDIIGDGSKSYEKKLEQKISQYGLGNLINFIGYQEDIPNKLTQYDIGLMCSKDEAFGRVTMEYMMSGLCVIAANTGQIKSLQQRGMQYKFIIFINRFYKLEDNDEYQKKFFA